MVIVLVGAILLGLESMIRELFQLDAWTPPLLTILFLWLGQKPRISQSALWVAILGILADGMAGSPVGLHVLYGVSLLYIAAFVSKQVRLGGSLSHLVNGLLGGVVSLLLMGLVTRMVSGAHAFGERMGDLLVPWLLTTALLSPVLFPVFERLSSFTARRREYDRL
jgi:cell shape-determining protein MreD